MSKSSSYFNSAVNKNTNKNTNTKEPNSKPIISKEEPPVFVFFKVFLGCLCIIIPLLFMNASILFLFNQNSTKLLDEWFPSECKKYPFGNKDIDPCGECKGPLCHSAPHCPVTQEKASSSDAPNELGVWGTMDNLMFGPKKITPNTEPAFPYKYYKSNYEDIIINYFSWIIQGLAKTNVGLNSIVKAGLTNKSIKEYVPPTAILFFGSIILLAIPLVFIYSIGGNTIHKLGGIMKTGLWTKLLIFFSVITGSTMMLDVTFATIASITIFIKLLIYPILTDWKGVKQGLSQEKNIIGLILGAAFIIAFIATPFDKSLPNWVPIVIKSITTCAYLTIIMLSIFVWGARKIEK